LIMKSIIALCVAGSWWIDGIKQNETL
jgi:hypothetical protein